MKKIQCLLVALSSVLLQSCSECATYGYFELQPRGAQTTVTGHAEPGDVAGLSDAKKFPSSYQVDKGDYQLFINQLVDRGYPTIQLQVKNKTGTVMPLKVHSAAECFYPTGNASGAEVDVIWRSEMSCDSAQSLAVDVNDDTGQQVASFSVLVLLRKNGQKCGLDGL